VSAPSELGVVSEAGTVCADFSNTQAIMHKEGIVKLSEFDQKLGKTRIHNSLIFQHSCYRPEGENQPNLT